MWYFFSVFDRIFISLHPKYFSWEEIVRFTYTINKDNLQGRMVYGDKITVNQAIAGNKAGLRLGVFPSSYRDFKIRLFALSTTEVSKEAR